jgi:hypothetical protein
MKKFLKFLIPISILQLLKDYYKNIFWRFYFYKYKTTIYRDEIPDKILIQKLINAWGNEGWSALIDYNQTIIEYISKEDGFIFECGSGLSTLLAGVIVKKNGLKMVSIENSPYWGEKIIREVKRNNLYNNKILLRDLKNYDNFDWYDIEGIDIDKISLCICDAPPGNTYGGRKGFLYLMKDKLSIGSIILVDDLNRKSEQDMIKEWQEILPFSILVKGESDPHAILKIA